MTAVDYVILLLALLSILIGVWRGFMTEALSLQDEKLKSPFF